MRKSGGENMQLTSGADSEVGIRDASPECGVPHISITYGSYRETDLDGPDQDQPTDFSQKYMEHMDMTEDFEAPRSLPENSKDNSFHEDSLKVYCTEGTPLNFSTATSLSDLSELQLALLDARLNKQEQKSTQKATLSNTPNTTSLPSGANPTASSTVQNKSTKDQDVTVVIHLKELTSKKVETTSPPEKYVQAEPEINNSLETPLMFSRCSSLCSLSSFDQQSIHDDQSSVISDLSRQADDVLSLSDLPDSPGQTMPPSPHQPKHSSGSPHFPLIGHRSSLDSYPHLKAMVHGIHKTIQGIEECSEDSLKLFAEENIPGNLSGTSSLSFLTIEDEPKIENKVSTIAKAQSSPILEEQEESEVNNYSEEDKDESLQEFQDKPFSNMACIEDSNSAGNMNGTSNLNSDEEDNMEACRDSLTPEKNNHAENIVSSAVPGKSVTFGHEVNYSLETPLVFSRCSSLSSLSSFDQQSIQDDGNSVHSDFSQRASEVVSPSDLPDSPSQTMPPSPHHSKHSSGVFNFTLGNSRPIHLKNDGHEVSHGIEEYPEDSLKVFAVENTPGNISVATSISFLTIEDEPKIEKDLRSSPMLKEGEPSVECFEDGGRSPEYTHDSQVLFSNMDSVQDSNSADNTHEDSDLDSEEEDILAACINAGMPGNRSLSRSSAHTDTAVKCECDGFGVDLDSSLNSQHNLRCCHSSDSMSNSSRLDNKRISNNNYSNAANDVVHLSNHSFSGKGNGVHQTNNMHNIALVSVEKEDVTSNSSFNLKAMVFEIHKSEQKIEESSKDFVMVFAEESTPCNISGATSLSFLTIEDELEIQNDMCISELNSPPNLDEPEELRNDDENDSPDGSSYLNNNNRLLQPLSNQERNCMLCPVSNGDVASHSDLDSEEEDILAACISGGMPRNHSYNRNNGSTVTSAKSVPYREDVKYPIGTPVVLSQCSSFSSNSSFNQPTSIHDGDNFNLNNFSEAVCQRGSLDSSMKLNTSNNTQETHNSSGTSIGTKMSWSSRSKSSNSANNVDDASDLDTEEEELLADCIRRGMPGNNLQSQKYSKENSPLLSPSNSLGSLNGLERLSIHDRNPSASSQDNEASHNGLVTSSSTLPSSRRRRSSKSRSANKSPFRLSTTSCEDRKTRIQSGKSLKNDFSKTDPKENDSHNAPMFDSVNLLGSEGETKTFVEKFVNVQDEDEGKQRSGTPSESEDRAPSLKGSGQSSSCDDNIDETSDLDTEEEELLADCIRGGMPGNSLQSRNYIGSPSTSDKYSAFGQEVNQPLETSLVLSEDRTFSLKGSGQASSSVDNTEPSELDAEEEQLLADCIKAGMPGNSLHSRHLDNIDETSDLDSEEEGLLADCIRAGMPGNSLQTRNVEKKDDSSDLDTEEEELLADCIRGGMPGKNLQSRNYNDSSCEEGARLEGSS